MNEWSDLDNNINNKLRFTSDQVYRFFGQGQTYSRMKN